MKKHTTTKTIMVITLVALLGFGGTALAYRQGGGSGWGGGDCYGGKQGRGDWGQRSGWANLSEEDQAKVQALRQKHFEETRALRAEMDVKRFALKSELAKQNPDTQAALKLQNELSELSAELNRKRIEHIVEMKKINPDAGRGFMLGHGRGRGMGGDQGYGRGCRQQ